MCRLTQNMAAPRLVPARRDTQRPELRKVKQTLWKRRQAMPVELTMRPATAADYDAIVRLWIESGLSVRTTGRDAPEAYRAQLERFPSTYLVAELDGRLIGVVFATHDERKGWINRLAVHPDHRRRGIARALIAASERALLSEGIEIYAALVEIDNPASVEMFDHCGYKRDIPVHYFHKRLRPDV